MFTIGLNWKINKKIALALYDHQHWHYSINRKIYMYKKDKEASWHDKKGYTTSKVLTPLENFWTRYECLQVQWYIMFLFPFSPYFAIVRCILCFRLIKGLLRVASSYSFFVSTKINISCVRISASLFSNK